MNDIIALEPCPFCGGPAEILDLDDEENDGANAGGSCVCCTRCNASGNVEFGRKENFVSNWNRRASTAREKRLREALEWIEIHYANNVMSDLQFRVEAHTRALIALKDTSNE